MEKSLETLFYEVTGENFTEFYKEHRPKLIWFLSHYTNNKDLAEDIAHEAFIQGLVKINQFDPERGTKVHTWIYKIGENLVKKDWKDSHRLNPISIDKPIISDENLTLSDVIKYDGNEEEIEQVKVFQKKSEIVKEAIDKLPKKYKKVIEMRELENMTYKDISDYLNINLSTIKSQISKGRKLIIKKVQSDFKNIDQNGLS